MYRHLLGAEITVQLVQGVRDNGVKRLAEGLHGSVLSPTSSVRMRWGKLNKAKCFFFPHGNECRQSTCAGWHRRGDNCEPRLVLGPILA